MRFRAVALFPLILAAGCLQPAPTPGASQQAIVGGTGDVADPGVVLVLNAMGQSASLCTGEVVSPHVIMTAAHCLDPSVIGSGGTFRVYAGLNLDNAKQTDFLAVKETHFNAKFDVNQLQGGNDIGVVILQNPTDIKPLIMNRTPLAQSMVGNDVRLVGYGVTNGNDTNGTTAGTKRQTTTKMASFDSVLMSFMDTAHLTCEGDSGGPAFMTINGREVIAGITSFGDRFCTMFGSDTRVDVYADSFVQPYIDMFDPRPKTPGEDGFVPGTVGATCMDNYECDQKTCAQQGDSGFCTTTCDPKNDQCPDRTHCGEIDSQPFCVRNGGGGCDMSGESAGSTGLLLLCAGLLTRVLRRRGKTR